MDIAKIVIFFQHLIRIIGFLKKISYFYTTTWIIITKTERIMMRVPWKAVLRDIKDAVSDYDCDVEYDGATEDYQGNVLCDFIVTFNDPDSIADWEEVIDDLYDYDDEDGWGWEIESNFPELIIGVVFEPGWDS